jgi:hypothetical protein
MIDDPALSQLVLQNEYQRNKRIRRTPEERHAAWIAKRERERHKQRKAAAEETPTGEATTATGETE